MSYGYVLIEQIYKQLASREQSLKCHVCGLKFKVGDKVIVRIQLRKAGLGKDTRRIRYHQDCWKNLFVDI